jgi:transposase
VTKDDGWRLNDKLWKQIEPLLPTRKTHPLGCHNPRVPDRDAMNGILFVLRTGCQWNALDVTGICTCSSAYRRFREWTDAGVFEALWRTGLIRYDGLKGIDWSWLSMDGAMTKAPLAGSKNRCEPDGPGQAGCQAQPADRSGRHSAGRCYRSRQPA